MMLITFVSNATRMELPSLSTLGSPLSSAMLQMSVTAFVPSVQLMALVFAYFSKNSQAPSGACLNSISYENKENFS